jgi:hypothetical protein
VAEFVARMDQEAASCFGVVFGVFWRAATIEERIQSIRRGPTDDLNEGAA